MKLRWLRDQRGSILLFTTILVVPLMIIFAGLAMDLAYHGTVDDELQRAMDAASLAGAGKLGFDASAFGAVRQSAQDYAVGNPYRSENLAKQINTSNFTWTTANNSGDNIVLGIWNAGTFTPSLEGNKVNAVRCQFSSSIPTSFLRLIGVNSLDSAAQAVAIANPPATPGCNTPILPIAVAPCAFQDAGGGFSNSNGCGSSLTWISSSQCTSQSGPQFCNTAAWASLDGSNPNAPYIEDAIKNTASATPTCNVTKGSGQDTPVNNGMITGKAFETLKQSYLNNRTPTLPGGDILKPDGSVIYAASKGGWETGVMLIKVDSCPPGPINGDHTVLTYSKFVVTQVYDGNDKKGGYCSTMPNPDPQAEPYCSAPKAGETAVFGYFRCDQLGQVATLDPVPRAALAQKLRLVR
jgi:Flp pilus assembly protein TadG